MTTEDSSIGRAFRDFDALAESVPQPAIAETWEAIRLMNIRDAAIQAASQGMRVLPVHGIISPGQTEAKARCGCGKPCGSPGKHPVMTGWQDAATTDPDMISEWFANGRNWNYGIALDGREWSVVEVDSYEGGRLRALREVVEELGPISTSGRGHHVFFRRTNLPNGKKIGPGMTVRGAGYFVVGPGSMHYSGHRYGRRTYAFDRLSERPDLVVGQVPGEPRPDGSSGVVPRVLPRVIHDGQERWRHLTSLAATLRNRGLGEDEIVEQLDVFNRNHCQPPKPVVDLQRIAKWVLTKGSVAGLVEEPPIAAVSIIKPMTLQEIAETFAAADSFEKVFELFHTIDPPTDQMDRHLVRRHLRLVMEHWKVPLKAVDDWFEAKAEEHAVTTLGIEEVEPWPEPVDGTQLIADLMALFDSFVQAPPASLMAASLWSMWTWVFDLFDIAPLLIFTSPTKGCGKTTMLKLIRSVCSRGLLFSNITGPALFRVIEAHRPTLLIDEADNFARFNDELKGLLNASHEKMTAQAIRLVGDAHEARAFSTWSPKALTALGSLPDTIEDRSIRLPMLRMPPDVKKKPARSKAIRAAGAPLARRCKRWALDNEVALRSIDEPDLDVGNDRASDNWGPPLTIAAVCGDDVLRQAKEAAASLTGGEEAGVGELLLDHVRQAFGDKDRIGTTELLKALVDRDDGPWAKLWASDVNDDDRVRKAAADLARRLRRFDPTLKATEKTVDGERSRGYGRTQFQDLWMRYPPPVEPPEEDDPDPDEDGAVDPGDLEHLEHLEQAETPTLTSGNAGVRKVREVREVRKAPDGAPPSSAEPIRKVDDPLGDTTGSSTLLDDLLEIPRDREQPP